MQNSDNTEQASAGASPAIHAGASPVIHLIHHQTYVQATTTRRLGSSNSGRCGAVFCDVSAARHVSDDPMSDVSKAALPFSTAGVASTALGLRAILAEVALMQDIQRVATRSCSRDTYHAVAVVALGSLDAITAQVALSTASVANPTKHLPAEQPGNTHQDFWPPKAPKLPPRELPASGHARAI